MAIEQWGFFSVPLMWHGTSDNNGLFRGLMTLTPVTGCFNNLDLSRLGFEHPASHVWGKRSNRLCHRRSRIVKKRGANKVDCCVKVTVIASGYFVCCLWLQTSPLSLPIRLIMSIYSIIMLTCELFLYQHIYVDMQHNYVNIRRKLFSNMSKIECPINYLACWHYHVAFFHVEK